MRKNNKPYKDNLSEKVSNMEIINNYKTFAQSNNYIIINASSIEKLMKKVNELLREDYQLIGGMTTYSEQTDIGNSYDGALRRFNPVVKFCQTLERKETKIMKGF